jgi:hypothetical protein
MGFDALAIEAIQAITRENKLYFNFGLRNG